MSVKLFDQFQVFNLYYPFQVFNLYYMGSLWSQALQQQGTYFRPLKTQLS